MGIEVDDTRAIIRALGRCESHSPRKLLILGNVNFFLDSASFKSICEEEGFQPAFLPKIFSPKSFGAALGFEDTDTLDIAGNPTIRADLGQECAEVLREKYDMVIDAGVLFWCFDPASALKNIFRMLRKDGVVVHITAVSGHYGCGYYNVHPLVLEQYYLNNGCDFLESSFRSKWDLPGRWDRILRKFGMLNTRTRIEHPGFVFLRRRAFLGYCFTRDASAPRPLFVPEIVGTLSFRKKDVREPGSVMLLTEELA